MLYATTPPTPNRESRIRFIPRPGRHKETSRAGGGGGLEKSFILGHGGDGVVGGREPRPPRRRDELHAAGRPSSPAGHPHGRGRGGPVAGDHLVELHSSHARAQWNPGLVGWTSSGGREGWVGVGEMKCGASSSAIFVGGGRANRRRRREVR